jgi:hypothetical protein
MAGVRYEYEPRYTFPYRMGNSERCPFERTRTCCSHICGSGSRCGRLRHYPRASNETCSAPLLWFSRYHHSLHTLLFAVIISVLAFFMSGRRWMPASFAFLAFHAHLVEDLVGSRGPDGTYGRFPTYFRLVNDGLGLGKASGSSMLGPMWRLPWRCYV